LKSLVLSSSLRVAASSLHFRIDCRRGAVPHSLRLRSCNIWWGSFFTCTCSVQGEYRVCCAEVDHVWGPPEVAGSPGNSICSIARFLKSAGTMVCCLYPCLGRLVWLARQLKLE
jgi:hypothetical protein